MLMEDKILNILPLLLIGLLLGGERLNSIKEFLSKIDFASFSPIFRLLGLNQNTVDFLSSENFSKLLEENDFKNVLPLLSSLFTSQNNTEVKEEEAEEEDGLDKIISPIKNVAPTDVEETFSSFFN